ncbi:hypothetical protein NDA11_006574 [Ustilago hordei]|nr:hypothetical protein NDA11_006574 [Ustilago hordei]
MTGRSPSTSPSKRLTKNGAKRPRTSSHLNSDTFTVPDFASRVIIALDLDAFYVSACRKRDPSLIGIPIGIQQKALVATISYEAREAGVNKLDSIKEAMKKRPDMILVNGEDLTYFRQVSVQVWKQVRSIVWGKKVEKLGMDELYCDVTEMVDSHLSSLQPGREGGKWFDLNAPGDGEKDSSYGFRYEAWPKDAPGHVHPNEAAGWLAKNKPDAWQERMLAAAQLASYIRQRISNEVGLTCSAGIAPTKSLAKLVGALNKPNQQTTFAPPIASPILSIPNGPKTEENRLLHHINTFLDPLDLRKLAGFGRVVVDKIRDHLHPQPELSSKQKVLSNFMDPASISDEESESKKVRITVGQARKMLSLEDMVGLFGELIGPKLWALACGRDIELVIPAPDFPLQLSIEDTYPYPSLRGQAIHNEICRLSLSLLRRLELELTTQLALMKEQAVPLSQEKVIKNEHVTIRDYKEDPAPAGSQKGESWLRYPLKLRLSVRQGWSNRVSKQTKMPVEIFDLQQSREVRAAAIAKTCRGLLRALIGGDDVVGDGMNLINIAALELSEKRPQRALGSFFTGKEKVTKVDQGEEKEEIDESFLASLPPELREEIAREYGIDIVSDVPPKGGFVEQAETNGKGNAKATTAEGLACNVCGKEMQVWMQHDHELYPVSGLPSLPTLALSRTPSSYASSADGDDLSEKEVEADTVRCEQCQEAIKPFMLDAHRRFHQLQDHT